SRSGGGTTVIGCGPAACCVPPSPCGSTDPGCPHPSDGCRWQVLLLVQEFEPREVRAMGRTTAASTAAAGPRATAAGTGSSAASGLTATATGPRTATTSGTETEPTAAAGVFGPVALAGQVRSCVAALRGGAPGAGAGGWAVEDRERVIAELDATIRELTVYRGQVLVAHKQDGRWGSVRDRDFVDYRSRTTGTGRGAAAGDLQLAEGLE